MISCIILSKSKELSLKIQAFLPLVSHKTQTISPCCFQHKPNINLSTTEEALLFTLHSISPLQPSYLDSKMLTHKVFTFLIRPHFLAYTCFSNSPNVLFSLPLDPQFVLFFKLEQIKKRRGCNIRV